ncbi:hypothetical protein FQR65_LT01787 [Abscondita terminalis]|nr:hypothetical protein FQR65_LT01787 [Abscondita terminalis]
MDEKLERVMAKRKQLKKENAELKGKEAQNEERIKSLEREIRRKNLIIKGIQENKKEKEEESEMKIKLVCEKSETDIARDLEEIYGVTDLGQVGNTNWEKNKNEGMNKGKQTISDRSPKEGSLEKKLRKITKTEKNDTSNEKGKGVTGRMKKNK